MRSAMSMNSTAPHPARFAKFGGFKFNQLQGGQARAWPLRLCTNAETCNAWRTAVRRVAQNHFMAAARSMTNPQFEAWRQKIIRFVATGPVDKHNSSYWEELVSKETDKEMEILRERELAKEMGRARPRTLTKRQQRTAAQAASDAAERAEAALRRAEKG